MEDGGNWHSLHEWSVAWRAVPQGGAKWAVRASPGRAARSWAPLGAGR